jgi:hypothetical protein
MILVEPPPMTKPLQHHPARDLSSGDVDDRLLVTLTRRELCELVRVAVADALAELGHDGLDEPLTVSGAEMGRRLGVSRSTMHELRTRDGCPALLVGDHYRYEPAAVMAWLRSRHSAKT